jgi:hypothetical protein
VGLVNGPSGDWPDDLDERHPVEVATVSGSAVMIDFLIRPEAVEVWFRERRRAILNRHVLRCWLAEPLMPLVVGGVAFNLDATGWSSLDRPDLLVWTLSAETLAGLRNRI